MVEANPDKSNEAGEQPLMQSFEEILRSSGYSPDQVRGIANELVQKKILTLDKPDEAESAAAGTQAAATPQKGGDA